MCVISRYLIYATRHSVVVVTLSTILDVAVELIDKVTIIERIKRSSRNPEQL